MGSHCAGPLGGLGCYLLVRPNVAQAVFAGEAKGTEIHGDAPVLVGGVYQRHRMTAAREFAHKDLLVVLAHLALGCLAQRILVDGNGLGIGDYPQVVGSDLRMSFDRARGDDIMHQRLI